MLRLSLISLMVLVVWAKFLAVSHEICRAQDASTFSSLMTLLISSMGGQQEWRWLHTFLRMARLLKNSLAIAPRMANWQHGRRKTSAPEARTTGSGPGPSPLLSPHHLSSPCQPTRRTCRLHLLSPHAIQGGEQLEKHESMPSRSDWCRWWKKRGKYDRGRTIKKWEIQNSFNRLGKV